MKRLLFFMLALCVLVAGVAPAAFAAETTEIGEPAVVREPGYCGEELTWEFQDGTLTITGSGPMDDFPDGPQWAEHKDEIEVVVLSGNVSTVGANAFTDYDKLAAVDFGEALQEIGTAAFKGCDGLTTISLPDTFRRFGEESFMGCPNLKEIHCDGGFPSFNLNCLWNTWAKIYFPEERPWSVVYIQQLEEAFKGRIEFLASDGSDPYVPTEPTEPEETVTETTVPPTTEALTELPVTEQATVPPTTETPTEAPTETPTTAPAETEAPVETEPVPETTEEIVPEVTEEPDIQKTARGGFDGLAIISGVMCVLIVGALIFRGRRF